MAEQFFTWTVVLPLGAILGWVASKLFGPSVDMLGQGFLLLFSSVINKKSIAEKKYLELKKFIENNHSINGHRIFSERKTYLYDKDIIPLLRSSRFFLRRAIKDEFIDAFRIDCYNEGDVFLAAMELFLKDLRKKDVQKIFEKYEENDQVALWVFLEKVEERRPYLLSSEMLDYLRIKQKKWKEE